jgi:hypothetical protein
MACPFLRTWSTGLAAERAPADRRGPCRWLAPLTAAFSLALNTGVLDAAALVGGVQAAEIPPAPLNTPEELVSIGARICGSALAIHYGVEPANLDIWLTPGLRIALDSGEIGVEGIRRDGLQFGWMLRGRPAPAPIGLCRTRGNGSVAAIEEQKD